MLGESKKQDLTVSISGQMMQKVLPKDEFLKMMAERKLLK